MVKPIHTICFVVSLVASLVNAADTPAGAALVPGTGTAEVFHVDQNALTPSMEIYLSAVTEKVRQRGAQDWPVDGAGRRIPGAVVVRLQLRRDGRIDALQVLPVADPALSGSNAVLMETITRVVQGAQPFPPFSVSLFAGHDLIALATTITVSPLGAHKPTGEFQFGAHGNNQDMGVRIRSRIPF
jgi:hypothetical protein